LEIRIGHSEHEYILFDVIERSHPNATDFWDGNWLNVKVRLTVGGFGGMFNGQLRANELESFYVELVKLYKSLSGKASLSTMERWLLLEINGDGKGHLTLNGDIMDEPGVGNILKFKLELDQTFIPEVLSVLEKVTKAFPVLGNA
jgi:hypothetical protein